MSKNTTRKGLAFGAGIALVASGIAAAPAQATGIANDWVTLVPKAGTTYSMITEQYFDISANFATAADNGAKLKFLVTDPSSISKYDIAGATIGDFDTIAADSGTGDVFALRQVQGTTDTVVAAFAAASGIELGDVVDGDSIAVTSGTAAVLTELNGKLTVSAVKEVASGAMTSAVLTAGALIGDVDTAVITKTAHGIVAGDIIEITGSDLADLATDTAANVDAQLDGYHVVTAATDNTFTIEKVMSALTTTQTSKAFSAATVEVHNITVDLAGTTDVTASSAVLTGSIAGGFDELSDGDAYDSAENMLLAAFGLAGQSGAGAQKTDGTAGRNANGSYIVDTTDVDDAGADETLRVVASAAGTVTVQAWIDSDADNVIDAAEYVSQTRTITFIDYDDVSFTTTLTEPVLAGTVLNATVSIDNNVNMAQIPDGTVTVDFKKDGSTVSGSGTVSANYDTTDKVLIANKTGLSALTAGVFSATATYVPEAVVVGAANFSGVTAATADIATVATPAASANNANVAGTTVKTGTTTFTIESAVETYTGSSSTKIDAVAGLPAVVTITKSVLATGSTVSAGGKTLASTGTSISFDTVTNADGEVVFDLTATGTKGTAVSIVVKLEDSDTNGNGSAAANGPQGYKLSSSATFTWADATIASLTDTSVEGYKASAAVGQQAKGGSYTLSYDLRDNFGASSTVAGTYRVHLTSTTNAGGAIAWTKTVPLSSGQASYSFVDDTVTATGNITVAAKLQKLNAAGTSYADVAGITESTTIYIGTSAATKVTTTTKATAGLTIEPKDFISGDLRLDANSQSHAYTAGNGWEITGIVSSSTGAPVPGAVVTVSAPGIGFAAPTSADGTFTDGIHGIGSITVNADATGAYTVDAWSHTAGTISFTVTSGAASTTTSQTWAYPTTFVKTSKIVLTMPSAANPASVVKGSVLLTDKWGNAVKNAQAIVFAQTGPGYVVSTPTAVSASTGSVEFVLLTGSNDTGVTTITVTHQLGTANDATDDMVATASVTIGAVASDTKVNAGSFKGYVALYAKGYKGQRMSAKVGKDWVVVASLASDFERVVEFTGAGVDVAVRIYIDRVLMDTINLTTK
jgi:hypothetical protein